MYPHPHLQPVLDPQFFCTVNGGASAFSVRARDKRKAIGPAVDRIAVELAAEATARGEDPNSEACLARLYAETEKLVIYTPQEWDAHCAQQHRADQLARAMATMAIAAISGRAS